MKIAVLIPCFNEEATIEKVILDFKQALPQANIFVYDNNSTDNSYIVAKRNGAIVKKEYRRGKGNVVRTMFLDIEADIYVMVDADDTYPAQEVLTLIDPIVNCEADMCVGDRHSNGSYLQQNKRMFHNFGNNLVVKLINTLYKENLKDIMSGYRAFNRDFVKHFPIHSGGFEIETEMSIHALDKRFKIKEVPVSYKDREDGSVSKLNTYTDGYKILKTIFWLFKDYKPLMFFSIIAGVFFIFSLVAGVPVIVEFVRTHYIAKVPSAILAVGLMLISTMTLFIGFVLDTVTKQHKDNFELFRLNNKYK